MVLSCQLGITCCFVFLVEWLLDFDVILTEKTMEFMKRGFQSGVHDPLGVCKAVVTN